MFESTKEQLSKLLGRLDDGEIQLPDFQRGWVWQDSDIRSLLASVINGFPVGALLTLQVGGEVKFVPRVIEGVAANGDAPDELLLDGQQRMTSLYQSLFAQQPVSTRNDRGGDVELFYYLDIAKAVSGKTVTDECIVGVPKDRRVMGAFNREVVLDLSTSALEHQHHMFPLNKSFTSNDWVYGWRRHWSDQGTVIDDIEVPFGRDVLPMLQRYEMPFIRLSKKNGRQAVCTVFEKVNTGGKKLDAFELLTAMYAADSFQLRADWFGTTGSRPAGRQDRLRATGVKNGVLKHVASTDFLQACTLLHSLDRRERAEASGKQGRELPPVTCRRDDLLELPLSAYTTYADRVEAGFVEASKFLNGLKVMWAGDVPYAPQLVALAAVYAQLGKVAVSAAATAKLEEWFWKVALCEYYGSATEGKIARDFQQLVLWIKSEGSRPDTLVETRFQVDRLDSLRSRGSAAYKAMHALMMKEGGRDFITGKSIDLMTFYQDRIDIHHIFPQKWCKGEEIEPAIFNSIINKAPLSARSNRVIGGHAPSKYLKRIEKDQGLTTAQLDDILRSHCINPDALREDDFDRFYAQRKQALAGLIAQTTPDPLVTMAMTEPVDQTDGLDELDEVAPDALPAEELSY